MASSHFIALTFPFDAEARAKILLMVLFTSLTFVIPNYLVMNISKYFVKRCAGTSASLFFACNYMYQDKMYHGLRI